jgi:SAM-dependent methyltransferase
MESDKQTTRSTVRAAYGNVALGNANGVTSSCCGPEDDCAPAPTLLSSCCSPDGGTAAERLGYTDTDLAAIPDGANLGLGCGNPVAIANLQQGETVLDLGSGAGMDIFLAASQVGETGKAIGVDMTPEMLDRARENARSQGVGNVEFRLGEIENLPVADGTVDAIISNCVVNLSPDKARVYQEAFRVLKPGGRLAISDVVARGDLPEEIRNDTVLTVGCMGGATAIERLKLMLDEAGFEAVTITPKDGSTDFIREWAPDTGIEEMVVSAYVEGIKPV